MRKPQTEPVRTVAPPEKPFVLGLPKSRPRLFLCTVCGKKTLDVTEFTDHIQTAHP
jgi:hypothetical protein